MSDYEVDAQKDVMRYILGVDDAESMSYYTNLAVRCMTYDMCQGNEDLTSRVVQQHWAKALQSKDLAWSRFVVLQAMAYSVSFQTFMERFTEEYLRSGQKSALARLCQEFAILHCGKSKAEEYTRYDAFVLHQSILLYRS